MAPVKVFWSERAPFADESLRRFSLKTTCPATHEGKGCHDASVQFGEVAYPLPPPEDRYERGWGLDDVDHTDPRWPTKCERCAYVFTPDDSWQHNFERKYQPVGTTDQASRFTLRKPTPGAMWDAWWMPECWKGVDGIALMVALPNGRDWHVDGRASNCTLPNDDKHRCWVRHGDPRTGNVHVDKSGLTCAAGAGSILAGNYHGFLHNGYLVSC